MKKVIIFGFFCLLLTNVFSQKDTQAWKAEKSIKKQYTTLKGNVSRWNGFLMIKEPQLNEFHKSLVDTIKGFEVKIADAKVNIIAANKEINGLSAQLVETQAKLDSSLVKQDELTTMGVSVDKNSFPAILYSIIIILIIVSAFAFFLFFRSNATTQKTEKRNEDLSEELKTQKANSLERETKLARELQTERNKNYN